MFWVQFLNFLTVLDIINLYYSYKNFASIVFSIKHKLLFDPMDSVCNLKTWNSIIEKNISTFLVNVRDVLKDDFGIFYHLKSRLYSFVFNNLSLYSIFAHFCFCKRTCDNRKRKERYCNFCSRIYAQICNDENVFHDIIIDEEDFISQFNEFFKGMSIFSLDVCHTHSLYFCTKKLKFVVVRMLKI